MMDAIQPALQPCDGPPLWEKILQNREGILLFLLRNWKRSIYLPL